MLFSIYVCYLYLLCKPYEFIIKKNCSRLKALFWRLKSVSAFGSNAKRRTRSFSTWVTRECSQAGQGTVGVPTPHPRPPPPRAAPPPSIVHILTHCLGRSPWVFLKQKKSLIISGFHFQCSRFCSLRRRAAEKSWMMNAPLSYMCILLRRGSVGRGRLR